MKLKNISPASRLILLLAILAATGLGIRATEITPEASRLAQMLDSMHVDKLWLAGRQVDWRTGEPNGKVYTNANSHTHCSAFAAAAAEKLGVYLLRPPEHSAMLLANAQQDWLRGSGTNQGWYAVKSPLEAQQLANAGQLVVATYKNHKSDRPGHIAIVRPSLKSDAEILAEGPAITQAGGSNYISSCAKIGFKNHPGAFENNELLYFAHPVAVPLSSSVPLKNSSPLAEISH